jgi:hypothetical protein
VRHRSRWSLPVALLLGTTSCTPDENATGPLYPLPIVTARPGSLPAASAPGPSKAAGRLLYRSDWASGVSLLGIDAERKRAVLRLESREGPKVLLETVDLVAGRAIDAWEERTLSASSRGFTSATSTSPVMPKLARLLSPLGPHHIRPNIIAPTFAVSNDGHAWVYGTRPTDGTDGDWLFASRDGGAAKRIDEGLRASYSPVISPDGSRVAFRACLTSPCDYGVYVSGMGGTPFRIPGIREAAPPVWGPSGNEVFVVGGKGRERCAFRVSPQVGSSPRTLHCVQGLEDVSLLLDSEGRTAVLTGSSGNAGSQVVQATWLLIEDGTVLARYAIDRGVGAGVLNDRGMLAFPIQKGGIHFIDLVGERQARTTESAGWFFGFDGSRFIGEHLVLLRKVDGAPGFEIVSIDAQKVLGGPVAAPDPKKPWL